MTTPTDYAVFEDARKEILHHYHSDPQILADLLFQNARKSIETHAEFMAVHHVGDRKFFVMSGMGAPKSDSLWSWRLLEFKKPGEAGKELFTYLDSVKERHFAPVVFMDKEYVDDEDTLTFQHFTPDDHFHYPLSSVAQAIQIRMVATMQKSRIT